MFTGGELLGFFGGAFTTLGFIPQVVRVFRLKSAREISWPFVCTFLIGIGCWLAYGIYFRLSPVIIWNSITFILAIMLLLAKWRYGASDGKAILDR